MTREEMQELARLVADEIMRGAKAAGVPVAPGAVAATAPSALDALEGNAEEASCFTCSGWFRCRPSFIIHAPTPTPEG